MPHRYTTKELERLVKIAARIVAEHGETYLPIFNRVYREWELSKKQSDNTAAALLLAQQLAADQQKTDCDT